MEKIQVISLVRERNATFEMIWTHCVWGLSYGEVRKQITFNLWISGCSFKLKYTFDQCSDQKLKSTSIHIFIPQIKVFQRADKTFCFSQPFFWVKKLLNSQAEIQILNLKKGNKSRMDFIFPVKWWWTPCWLGTQPIAVYVPSLIMIFERKGFSLY